MIYCPRTRLQGGVWALSRRAGAPFDEMQHEHEEAVLEQLQHDFYTEFGWLGPLSLARTSTCVHAQRISQACLASAAAQ